MPKKIIKNFKLCIIALSLFIVGCGTDDTIPFDLNTQNFSGVYEITALSSSDIESFTTNGETTIYSYSSVGIDFNTTWTFTDNNLFTLTGSFTATDTEEEGGEVISDTYTNTLNEAGSYVLDVVNETILLEFDGDDQDEAQLFNIVNFSEEEISIFSSDSQTTNNFSSEYTIEINLAKK